MSLNDKIEIMNCNNISSRNDFISFLKTLRHDMEENPETWVNNDLPRFLDALAAWVNDMDGYYINNKLDVPENPTWQTMADMLMAARVYS